MASTQSVLAIIVLQMELLIEVSDDQRPPNHLTLVQISAAIH